MYGLVILDTVLKLFVALLAVSLSLPLLNGCRSSASAASLGMGNTLNHQQMEEIRVELDREIPPPSKNRYLTIQDLSNWENPAITVQENMVSLHVLMADANPSEYGKGTMIRPVAARKQELTIRVADLPAALNAIPRDAWPYGRVIAIEEAHDAPLAVRPTIRRNMEKAMQTLNELGIVINEWNTPGSSSR